MPLDLDAASERRCRELLAAGVAEAKDGPFLSFVSIRGTDERVGDAVIAGFGRKRQKPAWLTSQLIAAFVRDRFDELIDAQRRQFGVSAPEVPALNAPDATADSILNALRTLPWHYEAMVPIPLAPEILPAQELELDTSFRLVTYDNSAAAAFVLPAAVDDDANYYLRQYPRGVLSDTVYLVGKKIGYIRASDHLEDLQEFANATKGLLGLLYLQGLIGTELFGSHAPPPAVPVIVYRTDNQRASVFECTYRWFRHDDSAAVRRMGRARSLPPYADPKEVLMYMRPAFRDNPTRTAARWYLDSVTTEGGPLQVVQAAIVLEILLGDQSESDLMGLTSLLANRLAYMISRSPTQRRLIISEFKRLYTLRSKIVHAGSAELDDVGREALRDLQKYAQAVLREQIIGLADDERFAKPSASG